MKKDEQVQCVRRRDLRTAKQWKESDRGDSEIGIETTAKLQDGDWLIFDMSGNVVEVLTDGDYRDQFTAVQ